MDLTIHVADLKRSFRTDRLASYLYELALDCKKRRDGFWTQFLALRLQHNLISLPLIVVSSITGVTSVANINATNNRPLAITVSVFGISAALLSAVQKYFSFAERAEHSRNIAKTYGRIARRIENMMTYIESASVQIRDDHFVKFVEDIEKDIDVLLQDVNDNPKHLITSKEAYEEFLAKLRETRKKHTQTSESPSTSTPFRKQVTYRAPLNESYSSNSYYYAVQDANEMAKCANESDDNQDINETHSHTSRQLSQDEHVSRSGR